MKRIRSAVLVGLACCVGATGAFAAKSTSTSKGTRSEKSSRVQSAKKKRSASTTKAKKSKTRSVKKKEPRTYAERFSAHFPDLPAEDLPEAETEFDEQLR